MKQTQLTRKNGKKVGFYAPFHIIRIENLYDNGAILTVLDDQDFSHKYACENMESLAELLMFFALTEE